MKIVIAWLAAVALAVVAVSSCSVNHKSSDYACDSQDDCIDGRICSNGFCVTTTLPTDARPGDGPIMVDAPRDSSGPDAPFCPPQCTSCREPNHECVIDCATTSCNNELVCPAGWNCTIGCSTTNSCTSGIDCTAANSCAIVCSGNSSCRDLECGSGECRVTCSGKSSCRDMDCSDSCACDITCAGGQNAASCEGNVCPAGCQGLGVGRCSSQFNPSCNTCQ